MITRVKGNVCLPWERSYSFGKVRSFVAIDKHQASLLLLRGWMEMDYML